eukprot:TRINITY_DN10482_c0_g1_i2.p2 TRINITY_DN10482_c0_g1~~TRINITY_DN10482_c0_g1_i2.p2  ORF type:complete len:100 (+),score=4.51 TRINITY_DN10482_c0_g1_i2:71-370(+)
MFETVKDRTEDLEHITKFAFSFSQYNYIKLQTKQVQQENQFRDGQSLAIPISNGKLTCSHGNYIRWQAVVTSNIRTNSTKTRTNQHKKTNNTSTRVRQY